MHILLVHLGALGAVLRSTSLLPAIKRKYPSSHITWVTDSSAQALLQNNSLIDRVLTPSTADLLALKTLEFDIGFCIDKSLTAIGIVKSTTVDMLYGFTAETNGAIVPATPHANELWNLGLNNHAKFFVNKKTEQQLVHEALDLGTFHRDPYIFNLTPEEKRLAEQRRRVWLGTKRTVIGINTGCSQVLPYKKLTIEYHRQLIQLLQRSFSAQIVLLGGGPEDELRNQKISGGLNVICSPTNLGLRDGAVSVAACDVVITGDSLGMHLAIALNKYVIAWFGPTCAQEIDLYGNGRKIITKATCAPCWKRHCDKSQMCYDLVAMEEILAAISRKNQSTDAIQIG